MLQDYTTQHYSKAAGQVHAESEGNSPAVLHASTHNLHHAWSAAVHAGKVGSMMAHRAHSTVEGCTLQHTTQTQSALPHENAPGRRKHTVHTTGKQTPAKAESCVEKNPCRAPLTMAAHFQPQQALQHVGCVCGEHSCVVV